MAIMLRSHKLQEEEVPATVRCIARCGAGVNNIPVARMTELGVPVFNTPGANANAVKELVVCCMLLASRGIIEGNTHVNNVINVEENQDYDKVRTTTIIVVTFGSSEGFSWGTVMDMIILCSRAASG